MTDPPRHPVTDEDTPTPVDEAADGTPRWVKVFGGVALVLVVLFVLLLVSGRGGHGPGRHSGSDRGVGQALPPGATHGGRQP